MVNGLLNKAPEFLHSRLWPLVFKSERLHLASINGQAVVVQQLLQGKHPETNKGRCWHRETVTKLK